jgi:O-antigen/teichoic acid export membrane protein
LQASGDLRAIRAVFLKASRWVLYLMLPVQIGLVLFGQPFLGVWLGSPEYGERCYPALVVLTGTLSLVVAQSVASRMLYGLGSLRVFARAALLEAAGSVILCLFLVRPLGILGAAWAAAIPNFVFCIFVIVLACRTLHVTMRDYVGSVVWQPLLAAVVPLSIWLAGWTVDGWLSLATALSAGLAGYAVIVIGFELRPLSVAAERSAETRLQRPAHAQR